LAGAIWRERLAIRSDQNGELLVVKRNRRPWGFKKALSPQKAPYRRRFGLWSIANSQLFTKRGLASALKKRLVGDDKPQPCTPQRQNGAVFKPNPAL